MEYRIGCSGYYNGHWKGIFYPGDLRQKDWFRYYSLHFNTLELNTTFYKFPEAKKLEIWFNSSPDEFLFSVKAPRLITHFKKLNECERLFDDFYTACIAGLQHKLGCVLFQFPPLFNYTDERLELLRCSLQPGYRNVVEFRHGSWWNESVYKSLADKNIIFCIPSHPTMPDQLVTTASIVYMRLHGKEKLFYSQYSPQELKKIQNSLVGKKDLQEMWVYFNNTASTAGIINALEFKVMMESAS